VSTEPNQSPSPTNSANLKIVRTWRELPDFEDEDAEGRFWAEHQLDVRLMQASVHRPDVRESTTITLRFDPRMLSRIKRIARRRYLNYQSMIKQWLSERMEQEMKD
jgi:predicted DNA binding CopG/RHH family protein